MNASCFSVATCFYFYYSRHSPRGQFAFWLAVEGLGRIRHAHFVVEPANALEFLMRFIEAERPDYFADRDARVVRPENTSVFIFVVPESDFVPILFLECRPLLQSGA